MTTTTKTPRLLEAAKEFNIGRETLIAFLTDKQALRIANSPRRCKFDRTRCTTPCR